MNKEQVIKEFGNHWKSAEKFYESIMQKRGKDPKKDPDFNKKVENLARGRCLNAAEHARKIQDMG